jgi:hypothetical protein
MTPVRSLFAKLILSVALVAGLSGPAVAGGRDKLVGILASITAAPQVCYAPIDADLLAFVVNEARPRGDDAFDEDISSMNKRIRAEAPRWTPEQMSEFCSGALEMARAFGLID